MEWYVILLLVVSAFYLFKKINEWLDWRYEGKQLDFAKQFMNMKREIEEQGFELSQFDERFKFKELKLDSGDGIIILVSKLSDTRRDIFGITSLDFTGKNTEKFYFYHVEIENVNLPTFKIEGSNIYSTKPEEITNYFDLFSEFIVILSDNGKLMLGTETDRDISMVTSVAKETIEVRKKIMMLTLPNKEEIDGISYAKYVCHGCGTELDFSKDICPNCNVKAPSCVICYNDPEALDEVSFLICCRNYVHTDHLQSWMDDNGNCPYCRNVNPLSVKVVEFISSKIF